MPDSCVNDPLAIHLKREIAVLFGSARNVSLLVLVAFLAGLAGPFGTYESLEPLARHLYWVLVVIGSAAAGHIAGTSTEYLLQRLGWSPLPRLAMAALVAACAVFIVVVAVLLGFGFEPGAGDLLLLYAQCAAVVGGVTFLLYGTGAHDARPEAPVVPKLLARLPHAKRGRLMRLAAQDHYVDVVTTNGRTLVPMRFGQAIAESAPEPGMQVHRSHWVALHAVSGRCRKNDRSGLRLSDGSFVPIGRKFRAAARQISLS